IFTYDAASASLPGETEARLDRDELEGLRIPALAAPEPGHGATDAAQSMRAPVVADQQVSGVVMVWPQDGESFAQADLARLQRVCELVAGPLARLLEIQAEREARHALEEVSELGAQAAGFHDPAYALRSVR